MDTYYIVAIVAILYLVYKWSTSNRIAKYINHLPGPKLYPIFGVLLEAMVPREEIFNMLVNWDKKYGPLYRTWAGPMYPNVHILKAHQMEIILNNSKHIKKGPFYNFLHPWLGTGLLTSGGQKWFTHRKMITPTFHFQVLDNFIDIFNDNCKILIQKINEKISSGQKAIDVYPNITHCALDIICESAMGVSVDAQIHEKSEYVQALYQVFTISVRRVQELWGQFDFIFYRIPPGKRYVKCMKVIHGFTNGVIKERKETRKAAVKSAEESRDDGIGRKKRKAFLDLLLDVADERAETLTDEEIREEVDTFMFEGHDTTTAAICWSLFLLGHHKDIQEEVFEEQRSIFGDDLSRPVTMKELGEMKLLERVIKEALRLYPSVPYISRELEEDIVIDGHVIPKGVAMMLNFYSLHRDPEFFPNPEEFNPDNFLPERAQNRHPYAYVPFSAGPRNCIGQKFAMLEEKTVLSTFIRHFKLESIQKKEEVKLVFELILRPNSGVQLRITPRT